jgi:hypothetical protein
LLPLLLSYGFLLLFLLLPLAFATLLFRIGHRPSQKQGEAQATNKNKGSPFSTPVASLAVELAFGLGKSCGAGLGAAYAPGAPMPLAQGKGGQEEK